MRLFGDLIKQQAANIRAALAPVDVWIKRQAIKKRRLRLAAVPTGTMIRNQAMKKKARAKRRQKAERRVPAPIDMVEHWFRGHPDLKKAYHQISDRFLHKRKRTRRGSELIIHGVGIGRRFCEKDQEYHPLDKDFGGLAIKVFVEKKVSEGRLKKWHRIPRFALVRRAKGKAVRVPIDVVSTGVGQWQDGRRLPTSGVLNPGRTFAFSPAPVAGDSGEFQASPDIGTIGAILRSGGQLFATSAGHVFCEPFYDRCDAPMDDVGLGVRGRHWVKIPEGSFFPSCIKDGRWVCDAMRFKLPDALVPPSPSTSWPPGFNKELVSNQDITKATLDSDFTAFVWVDNDDGKSIAIPADLQGGIPTLVTPVVQDDERRDMYYSFVWPLRLDTSHTREGDSGAPVFLRVSDGEVRLLGFHFLLSRGYSYAVDARAFLSELGDYTFH